ncbi:MAG: SRPBCC family protein [Melioribacteraceae bacterium]|nr:SRPBCC family protein [Melioribacteraceae bacterium]
MKKYLFQKFIEIKAPQNEVFEFHRDTNNLPIISPPFPKAQILSMSEIPLIRGSEIVIQLNFLLFRQVWEITISEFEIPTMISDFQKRGLFEYWHHYHIFEPTEHGVKMIDKVEFTPPLGILGRIVNPLIFLQLELMFRYRHRKTKEYFESK